MRERALRCFRLALSGVFSGGKTDNKGGYAKRESDNKENDEEFHNYSFLSRVSGYFNRMAQRS